MGRKILNRTVQYAAYFTEEEDIKIKKICHQLGSTKSEMIRYRLLNEQFLGINSAEVLSELVGVGNEMSKINSAIKSSNPFDELAREGQGLDNTLLLKYIDTQKTLEALIRKLLSQMIKQ